ncbi:MAG: TetR/AcrR family transcriptional regulator [Verrucomicrobiales bacterium]
MAKRSAKSAKRSQLTTGRVLRAAVALADEGGIEALSMRKLGQALGVEAMSLYNHVANKEEILNGIGDLVVSEIEIPAESLDWKTAMRQRAISAHAVFLRHPWVTTLIESQINMSPERLRYFDATIGSLRRGGFSIAQAYNAFLTLDSYIYGFALHEESWQHGPEERGELVADLEPQVSAEEYPHVAEIMQYVLELSQTNPTAGYESEFEFGLDLILDGLEGQLAAD